MPYELLDAAERAAIRDKKMPLEVLELMGARFPILSGGFERELAEMRAVIAAESA